MTANGPYTLVLGVAQDGGRPQAGCHRACCDAAREDPTLRRHVACLAVVDPVAKQRWIIDATPDFREQLASLDAVTSPDATGPDLDGILLTHAHIGHYTGLMFTGPESMDVRGIPVHAMPRMVRFLSTHGPWDQLVRQGNVSLMPIEAGVPFPLGERITATALPVPHRDEYTETVGFRVDGPDRSVLYIPDIDKWDRWDRRIEDVVADVDVAYLDGSFFADGELPDRDMSKILHPLITESMERFACLDAPHRAKIRFIHMNHTNPALDDESAATKTIEDAGFRVAREGERVQLQ